jgi:hypothetical protein
MNKRVAALSAVLIACVVLPSFVSAHPHEAGEVYVPGPTSPPSNSG